MVGKVRFAPINRRFHRLKTRLLHKKTVRVRSRVRAAMTLVEVVVALAITGLTVVGIVKGYIYTTETSVKVGLFMAANARVQERLEATHSAIWDTASVPVRDQLVSSNFPPVVFTLNKSSGGAEVVSATLTTEITQITPTPPMTAPMKRIRVDCIWRFKGLELVTNSIETCRAPDL